MKKKVMKKTTKRAVKRTSAKKVMRVMHGPNHDCPECNDMYGGMWGKDRSMVILLAAGIIILAVAGMWMAGWL